MFGLGRTFSRQVFQLVGVEGLVPGIGEQPVEYAGQVLQVETG